MILRSRVVSFHGNITFILDLSKSVFGSKRKRNMDEKGDLKDEKDKEEGEIVAEIIDSTGSQTGMQKVSTNEPLPCRFTFICFILG